jgi:hypothetical protein
VLRLFGLRSGEFGGGWRKLHIEEFHIMYTSSDMVREIRLGKVRCLSHGRIKECM